MIELTRANDPALWLDSLPKVSPDAHKYDRGHALVVGGYPMTGAARLAARAAARAGVGLTTVAVPEAAFAIYAATLTSIMVRPIVGAHDLDRLLAEQRFSALLIGPGAGVGPSTCAAVLTVLATRSPAVLDADALTSFADAPATLFGETHADCVMTPHEGEFARLFPEIEGSRIERASNAARTSRAIVVLKGRETIVAAPDGRVIVNGNAPPTLATAGSGDVLGGIILGLLAQGMEPFLAAAAAVWMHGAAAQAFGPGLIAEDLPDLLPAVLRQLV